MDSRVYVCQQPRGRNPRDLSSANRYGAIEFILDEDDSPGSRPSQAIHKINKKLQDFKEGDYVLTAGGDPVAIALVFCVLKDMGFNKIKYLRWERERDIDNTRKPGAGFYVSTPMKLKY